MSGFYFSNKRYFSRGNTLLPTELASQDRVRRSKPRKSVKKSKRRKRKKIRNSISNNKQSTIVRASKSKGNVNAITINIGNKEEKAPEANTRDFARDFAPTLYQRPKTRGVGEDGQFIMDETEGERRARVRRQAQEQQQAQQAQQ
eukprot:SAG11_NODE_1458_length_4874_cov_218.142827_1_plen_144_part_10